MKKLALVICALCIFSVSAMAAEEQAEYTIKRVPPMKEQINAQRKAREAAFEQRLGLTEVQKLKASEQRKQNFEKMKPVMEQIKAKRQEAELIRRSKLTVAEQEQKLAVIDKELAALQKQAVEIRKQNMKEFEALLTSQQKKTLKQMKKEGRKDFEKRHHPLPPPKFEK